MQQEKDIYFFEKNEFNWASEIENRAPAILKELESIIDLNASHHPKSQEWLAAHPHYVKSSQNNPIAWKTYEFMFFGMKKKSHIERCPKTWEALQLIPGLITAQFSFMEPGTHILPHKGYTRMVIRGHLGLIIPDEEKCAIRVGTDTVNWKKGEVILFDDSYDHEAWNKSEKPRAVLMFDLAKPSMGYTAEEICRWKIERMEDPFLLQLASVDQWLKWLENGYLPE